MYKLGIDVGGTFTDVVLLDGASGRLWTVKVATTPAQPERGVLDGIARILALAGVAPAAIDFVGHGTTIATNLIVEGKGARTALLTTAGFRDVLEMRRVSRHDRADLYDLFFTPPAPLVPRRRIREACERVLADGTIERPLDLPAALAEVEAATADGVEALAVCFLNAHVEPAHERALAKAVRARRPELFTTASCEVNPEMLEYERTSTTVVNAMLGPRCGSYIGRIGQEVRAAGIAAEVHFMQSNGGLARAPTVARRPVALLESGPAGGVTAAARLCARAGIANAITGDMGGTTFDVALVRGGRPEIRTMTRLETHAVRFPTLDIESIGAGGGSIARVDAGGGVHVGPESAGADPGPACYGRGGERPTVTDCNLILGYLDPERFLDGSFALDREAARRAVERHVARPLGMGVEAAAQMVRALANALMAQAIRLVTVERGYDPREFAYIPFGGAGPVHAVDLARELGIPRVIVPPMPGLFSAFGMLVADMVHEFQTPVSENLDEATPEALGAAFARLEAEARAVMAASGVPAGDVVLRRRLDCSYLAQSETVSVDVAGGAVDSGTLATIGGDFAAEHHRLWNFVQPERPVRIVNARLQAVGRIGIEDEAAGPPPAEAPPPRRAGERSVFLGGEATILPLYARADLAPGMTIRGAAMVEEQSSSLVIHRGDMLRVDRWGNLVVALAGSA